MFSQRHHVLFVGHILACGGGSVLSTVEEAWTGSGGSQTPSSIGCPRSLPDPPPTPASCAQHSRRVPEGWYKWDYTRAHYIMEKHWCTPHSLFISELHKQLACIHIFCGFFWERIIMEPIFKPVFVLSHLTTQSLHFSSFLCKKLVCLPLCLSVTFMFPSFVIQ